MSCQIWNEIADNMQRELKLEVRVVVRLILIMKYLEVGLNGMNI